MSEQRMFTSREVVSILNSIQKYSMQLSGRNAYYEEMAEDKYGEYLRAEDIAKALGLEYDTFRQNPFE